MKYWFTSDLHFGHKNVIKYEAISRPFDNIEDMDEYWIKIWNEQVGIKDTIYHIGDFSFRKPEIYLTQLKGQIKLIPGNHDAKFLKKLGKVKSKSGYVVEVMKDIQKVKINGQIIILCHYPFETWDRRTYGTWHLHGHVHNRDEGLKKIENRLHVGIDKTKHWFYDYERLKLRIEGQ